MRYICAVFSVCFSLLIPVAAQQVYEDDRIKVAVPDDWTVGYAGVTEDELPWALRGEPWGRRPLGAGLVKSNFRVYLLTHYGQASGIRGGRFGEISTFVAPWINGDGPAGCIPYLKGTITPVSRLLSRVDLYFDTRTAKPEALEECGRPSTKAVPWSGSYFKHECPDGDFPDCGGYFLNYDILSGKKSPDFSTESQMAFTISFGTFDPDDLPGKGNPQLENFLNEVTEIVKKIQFK